MFLAMTAFIGWNGWTIIFFPSPFTRSIYHLPFWLRLKMDYSIIKGCNKYYNTPLCGASTALWFSEEVGMMKQLGKWLEHTWKKPQCECSQS